MNKKFMPNYANDCCSSDSATIVTIKDNMDTFHKVVEKVEKKYEQKNSEMEMEGANMLATQEMTMNRYKRYIHDKIFKISIHPSLAETQIAINISEEAFEHMKEDPEYEIEVMKLLEQDLGNSYPVGWAPRYSVFKIGKTLEDYNVTDTSSRFNNIRATFTI